MVHTHHLKSGQTILLETNASSAVVSIGFFFDLGSRFENPVKNGITHFIEHLMFKGTKTKTAFEIVSSIEGLGGDLNGYTDKEELVIHCTVPAESWKLAFEVLFDMTFNFSFSNKDFQNERSIILNELIAARDDPEDLVMEDYQALIFKNTTLENPILGSEKTLQNIEVKDVEEYSNIFRNPEYFTCVIAGPITLNEFISETEMIFSKQSTSEIKKRDIADVFHKVQFSKYKVTTSEMLQFCSGIILPRPITFRESLSLQVISTAFGETMSSRLFQRIRESKGIGYSLTSLFSEFSDCAYFGISGSCEPHQGSHFYLSIKNELEDLLKNGLDDNEILKAKNFIIGSMIISSEQMENRLFRMINQFKKNHNILTINETISIIKNIGTDDILSIINLLSIEPISTLISGPQNSKSQFLREFKFENF